MPGSNMWGWGFKPPTPWHKTVYQVFLPSAPFFFAFSTFQLQNIEHCCMIYVILSLPTLLLKGFSGMSQLINEPTRITKSSSTLIDVILSSHPHNISLAKVIQLGTSDHFMVGCVRKMKSLRFQAQTNLKMPQLHKVQQRRRWPREIRY